MRQQETQVGNQNTETIGQIKDALHAQEVQRFEQLLKEDPAYAYERCGLGLLYSLQGAELIKELEKFGWKARDAQDLFNLGAIRNERGEHKDAVKYYEKALEGDSQHWRSAFNLALTYEALGEKDKARDTMKKCVKILEEKAELFPEERESLEAAKGWLEGK
jgi:tetratricopeptide (TPR) repeat protein